MCVCVRADVYIVYMLSVSACSYICVCVECMRVYIVYIYAHMHARWRARAYTPTHVNMSVYFLRYLLVCVFPFILRQSHSSWIYSCNFTVMIYNSALFPNTSPPPPLPPTPFRRLSRFLAFLHLPLLVTAYIAAYVYRSRVRVYSILTCRQERESSANWRPPSPIPPPTPPHTHTQ